MHRLAPALLVTGVVLLATAWLAEPAVPPTAARADGAPAPIATPALHVLDAQVDLLRSRVGTPPDYPAPSRDPFRFGRRTPVPAPSAPPADAPRSAVPAPPPLPRLIAILADQREGATVRRAVLSSGDGVVVARTGDVVGAFVVRQIDGGGVELVLKSSQATFHLSLR